jgi:hypothetical protein
MRLSHQVTTAHVKAEAARRIEAIMPDYKQRNTLALGMEAVLLHGPDPMNWPPELQAENAAALGLWATIKLIRRKSNEIEQMAPIPVDYRDDSWWADD